MRNNTSERGKNVIHIIIKEHLPRVNLVSSINIVSYGNSRSVFYKFFWIYLKMLKLYVGKSLIKEGGFEPQNISILYIFALTVEFCLAIINKNCKDIIAWIAVDWQDADDYFFTYGKVNEFKECFDKDNP
ncbi:hypothetical protein HZS_537, partial [Henneguya salminicola]